MRGPGRDKSHGISNQRQDRRRDQKREGKQYHRHCQMKSMQMQQRLTKERQEQRLGWMRGMQEGMDQQRTSCCSTALWLMVMLLMRLSVMSVRKKKLVQLSCASLLLLVEGRQTAPLRQC